MLYLGKGIHMKLLLSELNPDPAKFQISHHLAKILQ